jgi:phage replication O-like protein O
LADVQLESGHLRIANSLYEALYRIRIPGRHKDVITCVVRFTFGFQKTRDTIAVSQIASATEINAREVRRILSDLVAWGVVGRVDRGSGRASIWWIIKDFETWKPGETNASIRVKPRVSDPQVQEPTPVQQTPVLLPPTQGQAHPQTQGQMPLLQRHKDNTKDIYVEHAKASPVDLVRPEAKQLAAFMSAELVEHVPGFTPPSPQALVGWVTEFDRMLRLDGADRSGIPARPIAEVIRWCARDDFESANVQSPKKLRKRFAGLHLKATKPAGGASAKVNAIAENVRKSEERDIARQQSGDHQFDTRASIETARIGGLVSDLSRRLGG